MPWSQFLKLEGDPQSGADAVAVQMWPGPADLVKRLALVDLFPVVLRFQLWPLAADALPDGAAASMRMSMVCIREMLMAVGQRFVAMQVKVRLGCVNPFPV